MIQRGASYTSSGDQSREDSTGASPLRNKAQAPSLLHVAHAGLGSESNAFSGMEEQWFRKIISPRGKGENIVPRIQSGNWFFICVIFCFAAAHCSVVFGKHLSQRVWRRPLCTRLWCADLVGYLLSFAASLCWSDAELLQSYIRALISYDASLLFSFIVVKGEIGLRGYMCQNVVTIFIFLCVIYCFHCSFSSSSLWFNISVGHHIPLLCLNIISHP